MSAGSPDRDGDVGPVSAALEAALREEARLRGIVVWLDGDGVFSKFADGLEARSRAGTFPFPVRRLRGSWLAFLRDLEGVADGAEATPVVVHAAGVTRETVGETPLYELYCAGKEYRRSLPTLVREVAHGVATPEQIDQFLTGPDATLEAADAWLVRRATPATDDDAALALLGAEELHDRLRAGALGALVARAPAALWRRAEALLGIDAAWREGAPVGSASGTAATGPDLADELATWALCVEFVHDLRRRPDESLEPLKVLPKPAVDACGRLAGHLRVHHGDVYVRIADAAEVERVGRDRASATAADLGKIDTFRFEDQRVMAEALALLGSARGSDALALAAERIGASFWCRRDPGRRIAWTLVELGARLANAIAVHGQLLDGATTLDDAVDRYADRGWQVDRAHRLVEQARQQLPLIELEELDELRLRLDHLRGTYRQWADAVSVAWNLIAARSRHLPSSSRQQRTLFEDEVMPLVGDDEATAYVMVDALRFEMGRQLADAIGHGSAAEVTLTARLAELPTVTEIGMNVLAPVARNGRLALDLDGVTIRGFRAGTKRVDGPEDRRQVIHDRVGGEACPRLTLEEVLAADATSLRRRIARGRVIVVFADGIDRAGERGMGLVVFEQELQNLRAAWRLLQQAGVRRFVITADHGFLLHDASTRQAQRHGQRTDPDARHVVSAHPVEQRDELTVASRDLDYDGGPVWFQFPTTIAPFERGKRTKDFAHGGPSPQERVIPVIVVRHRHGPGGETAQYTIELEAEPPPVPGMHGLRARVRSAGQTTLAYGARAELELVLACVEDPGVAVELCDVRDARVEGGAIRAAIDRPFEVYFRLVGTSDLRASVRLRHATRAAGVTPVDSVTRYQVEVRGKPAPAVGSMAAPALAPVGEAWLEAIPAGGARDVLRHLAQYGSIDEATATQMLGGGRTYRAFCRQLDADFRTRLPFTVRIELAGGAKVHVRGDR